MGCNARFESTYANPPGSTAVINKLVLTSGSSPLDDTGPPAMFFFQGFQGFPVGTSNPSINSFAT